jgi:glycerophosphoryl diester phosphodiesterase
MWKKTSLISILVILVWLSLHILLRTKNSKDVLVIYHRGNGNHTPENTLVAVNQAIDSKADLIEIDVRRSADGVLMLMHDRTIDRTTNSTGEFDQLSFDEIRTLDAGSYFSPNFTGEPVPTLDEVLEAIKASSATLVLEVKDPQRYPGIEKQITDILQEKGITDQAIVVSFDQDWLQGLHDTAPGLSLGFLSVYPAPVPPRNNIVYTHWASLLVDPTLLPRLHHKGYTVWAWTVDQSWSMRALEWLGVDAFVTNVPELHE